MVSTFHTLVCGARFSLGTIVPAMKKFLLIFMLLMLPLQASWGVVSVYCQPEREICIEPCYSETQEQRVYLSDGFEQTGSSPGFLDQYEHSCQAPAASIISSSNQTIPSLSASLALQFQETPLSLLTLSERPERPQWLFVA
ncbi:hypothetical protein H0A66_10900 [Alcaligenaceae bacterium]|nr:hypothetical protein [Alcaligenaceae bacterium]